jgi:hypothetical protein
LISVASKGDELLPSLARTTVGAMAVFALPAVIKNTSYLKNQKRWKCEECWKQF